jgi:hypothetical protein
MNGEKTKMILKTLQSSLLALLFCAQLMAQTTTTTDASSAPTKPPADVNVVNTPSVNIVNTPTVQLAGTSTVQVSGTTNVDVQNDSSAPVIVQDVSTPKRTPFQANAIFPAQPFANGQTETGSITVPAGKRLVIEHVSARAVIDFGDATPFFYFTISTTVAGVTVEHSMATPQPFTFQCSNCSIGTNSVHAVSQEMKLYADPGSTITATVLATSPRAGTTLNFAVSGYLEDAP